MRMMMVILAASVVLVFTSTASSQQDDPFDESPYLTMYQLLPRAYKMTPEQRKRYEDLMDLLVAEYHDYLADRADVVEKLRSEYDDLKKAKAGGADVPRVKLQSVRRRCAAVVQASPLGVRNVTARIEEFLPPEQVAAARGIKPKRPTTTRATVAKKQQPLAGSSGRAAAPSVVQRASKPVVPPRPPRSRLTFKPAQAWPSYVDGFIVNYSLDADRAARARQVLAELKGEADRHHQQQKLSYDRAAEITDVRVRREQLDRLEEPVGKLFDRLRSRLEQLARVDQPGA